MKQFSSPTQQIGLLGENIACNFLREKGFKIIERNYTKKIGELDIVAQKGSRLHFIEVKTIVSRETFFNPFENVTRHKLRKFSRTIEWYLIDRRIPLETLWQIDAIAVTVSRETRRAKVEVMWNVIA